MRELLLLVGLFAVMSGAQAQIPDTAVPPKPSVGANATATYLLGPEDVIAVRVINFPELTMGQVVIPSDGTISIPPKNETISIVGKTTTEVAELLTTRFKRYVINPAVNVSIVQQRKESLLVYGYANRVGNIEYRPNKHILEVLAEAGGPTLQADLQKVTVTRRSGEKRILDLSHPETKGGTEVDIIVEVGDIIYIPERRTQFTIVGEVARPGSFEYKEDMTVMDALTMVGGVRETADLVAAKLIRDEKEQGLDLEALLRRGDGTVNIKLLAGDRIVVPEIRNRVYLFGAVGRPGFYLFKPSDTVIDALNGAGGPTREADLTKVNHIRMDKAKKTSIVKNVNLEVLLKKGDLRSNVELEPGDILYIPDKRKKFQVQDLFSVFMGVQALTGIGNFFGFGR